MEEFKLKSIDEFDELFVAERKQKEAPVKPKSSLIPQMEQSEPAEIDLLAGFDDFGAEDSAPAQGGETLPGFVPAGSPAPAASPRAVAAPPAPLYESPKMSETDVKPLGYNAPAPAKPLISDDDDDEYEDEPKARQSAGAYIGKAIAVIMIVLTVLVFIFGSFLAVFLDTSRNLGKYSLNTQSVDITDERVSYGKISKGDLIISEKIDASEYAHDDFVSIPSSDAPGCDIAVLDSVGQTEDGQTTYLSLIKTSNLSGQPQGYDIAAVNGRVKFYVPMLAGLLGFALSNSVLFILLFIAFVLIWSLVIVFIEMSQKMKKYDDDDEDDEEEIPGVAEFSQANYEFDENQKK